MNVIETILPGVLIIEPILFGDERGFFLETFSKERYLEQTGISVDFVQDNHSRSKRGVLRGLHLQKTKPQGKLVRVSRGKVYDIAVDVSLNSPTFGKWVGVTLDDEKCKQFYIPPGYAHGFLVLSEIADFEYKCTEYYDPTDETGIRFDDKDLGINWGTTDVTVSEKDLKLPSLQEFIANE